MNIDLTGKKAIVCGSTQGIGLAAALELASLGATVVLIARNEDKLKQTLKLLPCDTGQCHSYICADFSNPTGLKTKVDAYLTSSSPIHVLVNNTGGPPGGLAVNAKIEEFQSAFSNHLICNHIMVRAVIEGMKSAGYGRIINVISTSVKLPIHGLGVSNTIRGAVANWSKTLANELGEFGITVNNVLPGATNTVRLQSILENKASKSGKSVDEIAAEMAAEVPMKRVAQPEEIASVIGFLASPAASYVNGINVPVDGGRTGCL